MDDIWRFFIFNFFNMTSLLLDISVNGYNRLCVLYLLRSLLLFPVFYLYPLVFHFRKTQSLNGFVGRRYSWEDTFLVLSNHPYLLYLTTTLTMIMGDTKYCTPLSVTYHFIFLRLNVFLHLYCHFSLGHDFGSRQDRNGSGFTEGYDKNQTNKCEGT